MSSVKTTGKTEEEALRYALAKLGANRDEVKIKILQKPKKKLLGLLGSTNAILEVRKLKEGESIHDVEENVKEVKKNKKNRKKKKIKKVEKKNKKIENKNNNKSKEKISKIIKNEKKIKEIKKNKEVEEKKEEKNINDPEEIAIEFLSKMLSNMNIDATLSLSNKSNNINIDIAGDDMALVIGRRGQTLDSLQYITSLVVNKDQNNYVRILLDSENYRIKRKKTLQSLARKLAKKAKHEKKNIVLEPMNPYERRIIHSTLQGIFGIKTISKGKDPYRKVVICYNKSNK